MCLCPFASLCRWVINKSFHDKSNSLSQLQGKRYTTVRQSVKTITQAVRQVFARPVSELCIAPTGIETGSHTGPGQAWESNQRTAGRGITSGDTMVATARTVVCLFLLLCVCQIRGSHIPVKMNRTIQNLLHHYVSIASTASTTTVRSADAVITCTHTTASVASVFVMQYFKYW